jgi:hypothetical protein
MNEALLQTLSNCYRTSSSLVIIMDLQWKLLWSNRKPEGIGDLPQQLGISRNHVENSVHFLQLGGMQHECRLLCNLADGFRIAEISPAQEVLRMDPAEISAAVHSISTACSSLHDLMKEMDCEEEEWILNAIIGSCYRLYRSAYLQNEVSRLQGGQRLHDHFCIQTVLRGAYQKIRNILRSRMQVQLNACDQPLYIQGDAEELASVILSAVVLCCNESRCFQELAITLNWQEGLAVLTFCAEETGTEPEQSAKKIQDISAGNCEAERAILNLFCHANGGSWMMLENKEEGRRTCRITIPAGDTDGGSISLCSPQVRQEDDHFGKYSVFLSCMHYRDMF